MIKVVNNINDANCITHSGTMHADEVFATAFLELYLGDIKVFRTNQIDTSKLNDDVLVYDVGRGKFDHHQLDARKRDNGITYSSFGLLWDEYGKDYLKKNDFNDIDDLFIGIDKDLVEGIDADDNGIFPKVEAIYKVKTIPNIIKLFNPSFDSDEIESEQFIKAVNLAKEIFKEEVLYINGKVHAEKEIKVLIDNLNENDKYIILDKFLPYEETILNDERANNILFVAFPSNRGGYAIKTIYKSSEDKTPRLEFPKEWAGLEKDELFKVSNIEGLKFCHSGRFIVSCDTMDAVYKVLDKVTK